MKCVQPNCPSLWTSQALLLTPSKEYRGDFVKMNLGPFYQMGCKETYTCVGAIRLGEHVSVLLVFWTTFSAPLAAMLRLNVTVHTLGIM